MCSDTFCHGPFEARLLLIICWLVDDELSYSEIQERLHVPEEDVTRLTHSLSCAKYKILNKSPASKTVSKTDTFSMNKKFTDRMRRIRVGLLSALHLQEPDVQLDCMSWLYLSVHIVPERLCGWLWAHVSHQVNHHLASGHHGVIVIRPSKFESCYGWHAGAAASH